jgi:hypothetical protein
VQLSRTGAGAESRDPGQARVDPVGAMLSTAGLGVLTFVALTVLPGRERERAEKTAVIAEAMVDILHSLPVYKLLMRRGAMEAIADVPRRTIPLLLEGARARA